VILRLFQLILLLMILFHVYVAYLVICDFYRTIRILSALFGHW
jgi:hypothetical protein